MSVAAHDRIIKTVDRIVIAFALASLAVILFMHHASRIESLEQQVESLEQQVEVLERDLAAVEYEVQP